MANHNAANEPEKRTDLLTGIQHSLDYLSKPSSKRGYPVGPIRHEQVVRGLHRLAELIQSAPATAALNEALKREFHCYAAVGYDDRGSVLFTGYYTPIFPASRTKNATYRFPSTSGRTTW